jgi:hypothetical protein
MIEDFVRKVRQQQGGILLDTNVLLLHLMHRTDRGFASAWKRTQQFTRAHAQLIELAVQPMTRLVTTPYVLTEATNLSTGIPSHLRVRYMSELHAFIARARERSLPARHVATDPAFDDLGLADVAPVYFARGRPLILTVDAPLTALLEQRKLPYVNLNHVVFSAQGSAS